MGMIAQIAVLGLLLASAGFLYAEDDSLRIKFDGVLDVRFGKTGAATGWLDGGLGKTRYGGADGESANVLRLSQASLLMSVSRNDVLSARIHINIDAEPDREQMRGPIDLIEAFVSYCPVLSPQVRLKTRGGVFFPPVSLENRGTAWTTPYTITTSAINSWIGEEVRTTGVEATLVLSIASNELAFTGAAFGNNDPTGTLLAWRGWALHDRQTGFSDRLPLAPIPSIEPGGLFQQQPRFAQPFREIDGRLGTYSGICLKNRYLELNGIYFNNRGRQSDFDGFQYAWKTDFANAGVDVPLPGNFEILSQFMAGRSRMGAIEMVNIDFYALYGMVTSSFGRNRVTLRYDNFRVQDRDQFVIGDNNNEDGSAWTFAYMLSLAEKHRLAFELLRVESDRPVRATLQIPIHSVDTLFQTSFRFQF